MNLPWFLYHTITALATSHRWMWSMRVQIIIHPWFVSECKETKQYKYEEQTIFFTIWRLRTMWWKLEIFSVFFSFSKSILILATYWAYTFVIRAFWHSYWFLHSNKVRINQRQPTKEESPRFSLFRFFLSKEIHSLFTLFTFRNVFWLPTDTFSSLYCCKSSWDYGTEGAYILLHWLQFNFIEKFNRTFSIFILSKECFTGNSMIYLSRNHLWFDISIRCLGYDATVT